MSDDRQQTPTADEVDVVDVDSGDDGEEVSLRPFTFQTAGFDARFPNQNQTKHCFQNYVDYFRCTFHKGEDYKPCQQFFKAYHALCPNEWKERWDTQRENGNFPADLQ